MLKKKLIYIMAPAVLYIHLCCPVTVNAVETTKTPKSVPSDSIHSVSEYENSTGWIKHITDYKDAPYGKKQGSIDKYTEVKITDSDNNGWLKISWSENEEYKEGYVLTSSVTNEDPSHRELYIKDANGQYAKYIFDDNPEVVDRLIEQIKENYNNEKQPEVISEISDLYDKSENKQTHITKTDTEDVNYSFTDKTVYENNKYKISVKFVTVIIVLVFIIIMSIVLIRMGGDK